MATGSPRPPHHSLRTGYGSGSPGPRNPEKPDFPDPDPDFRISAHAVAIGAKRATYSQNFRPLAAIVPEIPTFKTIIVY